MTQMLNKTDERKMHGGRPFIKELMIQNFRCFSEPTYIELAVPDNSLGSGLNLLVGNNGTGKTSVLEAIDYLFGGRYKGETRLKISDFNKFDKEINISGQTETFSVKSSLEYYKDKYFDCSGVNFIAAPRDRRQPGKLLSSPISAKSTFTLENSTYYNVKDSRPYVPRNSGEPKTVDMREVTLDPARVGPTGVDIFYFDKNRARHLASGTYRTVFDAICEDLNWKFQKKLRTEEDPETFASKVSNEIFSWALDLAQKGTGRKLGEQFSDFFENDNYKNIRFELLSLLEPFSSAFIAIREDDDIHQVPAKRLGSGVELVLALLLQRLLSEPVKSDKIFLIDEPEMHLHPAAQEKLAQLLLEEARNSQVIISSHSPYLLQRFLRYGKANVFTASAGGEIQIQPQTKTAGYFPWSPSFGEVNFKAFSMPTIELHNELYGYIQERKKFSGCDKMDDFLEEVGVPRDQTWKNAKSGKTTMVTLCTFVRHCIHHPENRENGIYDEDSLRISIQILIKVLESIKQENLSEVVNT